jgi:hypothetical protein
MNFWRDQVGTIRREVAAERVGWLLGALIRRQLMAFVALLPAFAAMLLLRDGTVKSVIVWSSFGAWVVWNALAFSVGAFFISRWTDKRYGERPRLSKEYRKR